MSKEISKKFGGQTRAENARTEMSKIFSDPNHELYLEKDIDLAHRFDVSRLTIYNIREQLRIPPRTDRILSKLKSVDTKQYTKRQLSALLGLKYQNLYKIIREYRIKVKPDVRPIESMIKFQKSKKIRHENVDESIKKLKDEEKVTKSAKKAKEEVKEVAAPAKEAVKPAKKAAKKVKEEVKAAAPVKKEAAKPAKKAKEEVKAPAPAKEAAKSAKKAAKPAKKSKAQ